MKKSYLFSGISVLFASVKSGYLGKDHWSCIAIELQCYVDSFAAQRHLIQYEHVFKWI